MPYEINYHNKQGYNTVTVEGDFVIFTLKDLTADIANSIKTYSCCRVLNDMRRAILTRDIVDIYNN